MNKEIVYVAQILLAVLLIVLILIQNKGAGLGSAFGGGMAFYSTRRGVEKIVFYLTIIIAFLFMLTSAARLLL